jgi:cytochrome c peroxidase
MHDRKVPRRLTGRKRRTIRRTHVRAFLVGLIIAMIDLAASSCLRARSTRATVAPAPSVATLTALGRTLFFDASLSASGRMACASCHDPKHDWGPPNARAVQLGGPDGTSPGVRAVPSLMYAQDTPFFTEHYREDDGNDADDQGPAGGRMWDGRVSSAREQAELPLLSPFEMANGTRASVVARLRQSPSASGFRAAFGDGVFDDSVAAWNGLVSALAVFQESAEDFYPYSSKYDAVLRGEAQLSANEARGLALFNDERKGNCARCHVSAMIRGALPQFTDRGFIAIGAPRNKDIPANADPKYFDLGLCGPVRSDLEDHPEYCGLFKTPTLRNVARRAVFFHNGVFTRLEDAVRFYARRDVEPELFYPTDSLGRVTEFDDLPAMYRSNLDTEPPFDRRKGGTPALTDDEVADIVAFLKTLNDGYDSRVRAADPRGGVPR